MNVLQKKSTDINSQNIFERDILAGLSSSPKYLFSKYLYDTAGSRIFQDIMSMPEYYLTDCEFEILVAHKKRIESLFFENGNEIDLIELGAGDGAKTRILLEYFLSKNKQFKYIPVDISKNAVLELVEQLNHDFESLVVDGKIGDYFEEIHKLNKYDHHPKVLLFLGSNIGNYEPRQVQHFFEQLASVMGPQDRLFIGFDLKKDPFAIFNAYNDPHGHTKRFNLNLLNHINRVMDADFDISAFQHYESYDPQSGLAKSYLISALEQKVTLKKLDRTINFAHWEPILVEISQKYDVPMIKEMAAQNGFRIIENFSDSRQYFINSLWQPVQ
ncbi:MAG: L-histidine N(alpha)-methyltransferase [candidate division KSB1 bacterium]|nr:L-histidine N(alpha)-methyltransferase [candidate division KSB1 bacterium]